MSGPKRFRRSRERGPERITFANLQRRETNEFAEALWSMVRGAKIRGQKFHREHPFGPYTLDFVCLDLKLNIEVDGQDHWNNAGIAHDRQRDAILRSQGFEMLRVPGYEVLHKPAKVCESNCAAIDRRIKELEEP